MNGVLIVIEGNEGVGKSAIASELTSRLRDYNYKTIQTREPGGTPLGEKIRNILKEAKEPYSNEVEFFLVNAARAEHIEKVIKPKLQEGYVVICDRFYFSTYAHQIATSGCESLENLHNHTTAFLMENIKDWNTVGICLKADEFVRKERLGNRGGKDVFENRNPIYLAEVAEAYSVLERVPGVLTYDTSNSETAVIVDQIAKDVHNTILTMGESKESISESANIDLVSFEVKALEVIDKTIAEVVAQYEQEGIDPGVFKKEIAVYRETIINTLSKKLHDKLSQLGENTVMKTESMQEMLKDYEREVRELAQKTKPKQSMDFDDDDDFAPLDLFVTGFMRLQATIIERLCFKGAYRSDLLTINESYLSFLNWVMKEVETATNMQTDIDLERMAQEFNRWTTIIAKLVEESSTETD